MISPSLHGSKEENHLMILTNLRVRHFVCNSSTTLDVSLLNRMLMKVVYLIFCVCSDVSNRVINS